MTLRLELSCDITESRRAAEEARRFFSSQGCEEADAIDCELALVEACNNAILYATPEAHSKPIVVDLMVSAGEITIRVTDHTPGFDWPAKASLPKPGSERGRGIFLIQSVMNSAAYIRGPGENALVLVRKRSEPQLHAV